jgi:DnaJ-class molecular chaperone
MSEKSPRSPESLGDSPRMMSQPSNKCPACNGAGLIHARVSAPGHGGQLAKAACGACGGSGERGDSLSKVVGQPAFDLRK